MAVAIIRCVPAAGHKVPATSGVNVQVAAVKIDACVDDPCSASGPITRTSNSSNAPWDNLNGFIATSTPTASTRSWRFGHRKDLEVRFDVGHIGFIQQPPLKARGELRREAHDGMFVHPFGDEPMLLPKPMGPAMRIADMTSKDNNIPRMLYLESCRCVSHPNIWRTACVQHHQGSNNKRQFHHSSDHRRYDTTTLDA